MTVTTHKETLSHYIDGSFREARSGETIETTNPATGEVIASFPKGDSRDIDDAVQAAQAASDGWRATPALERARMVTALAARIEEQADELAMLDVLENGSPIKEMRSDAFMGAFALRYFAGLALELRGETIPSEFDRIDYTVPSPFGVVGRIIPFNHPFMFASSKSAAPLIAGNTLILKPSEHTSMSTIRLAELADGILPKGVFNVVTGTGAEAGDALVVHPGVRRLAFTGSDEIGRMIQQRAATHVVKSVSLELGGKNPLVVMPDADLDQAVAGALRGMNFTWQGQSCGSTSRLIVQESIHDELVEQLAERMESMRSGMPEDESTDTGAIVHRGQYEKVLKYLQIGKDEGAHVAAGGGTPDGASLSSGMFVRPTLFTNVKADSRLAQEEIFGPVLAVIKYDSYEDALRIANGVQYGLTASIFTQDLRTAHRFARDVQAGYVWVNDSARHFPGVPFGGFKDSGIGREESFEELVSYTQVKNVNINFG
jgi:acyl-CoA reductase-like NAD-dependent aldehyde dehydrogenase